MTSEELRDPVTDHLLTPQNAALVVIDYQPSQLQAMTSMDRELLVDNIVSVTRLGCDVRPPSRSVHRQRCPRPGPDPSRAQGRAPGGRRARSHDHERLGGPRVPSGGRGDRPQEPDHDRAVDRDLPLVPGARRSPRRFRRVSGRRRGGRNVSGSAPCGARADRAGGRAAHQLGGAGRRAATGLGPGRHRRRRR